MWFRLMALAFVFNGLGDFGLRVLSERGLGEHTPHYLIGWYAAGLVGAVAVAARAGGRPTRGDIVIGCGLGLCSLVGQTALGLALAGGIDGSTAYPVTKTGSVFLVAAAGVVAFRERVGPAGLAGIALGLAAVVLLSLE